MLEETIKKQITSTVKKIGEINENFTLNRINKANYDKTYIGFVSEKVERDDGTYKWRVQAEGIAYDVSSDNCNISKVGQRVRLYVPVNKLANKYAEVIDYIFIDKNCIEITKVSDNEVYAIYKSPSDEHITYKQTICAEGEGNTRTDFTETIEMIEV